MLKHCDDERASSETREFKDLTKRDALAHMRADLQKLIENVPVEEKEAAKKNFDGFLSYYEKFLKNDGTQVEWEKIEKLPNDALKKADEKHDWQIAGPLQGKAVLLLIEMYRDRPVLWNCQINEYRDKNKRHDAFMEIANHFKVEKENLLSHFSREVKKENADDVYKSKWHNPPLQWGTLVVNSKPTLNLAIDLRNPFSADLMAEFDHTPQKPIFAMRLSH
ncbi:hypothetical protein PGB90_003351 [Kerria lacca]